MQCNMLEAKSQLSKLVQAALSGEDVIIANKGVPVVRLVKIGRRVPPASPAHGRQCLRLRQIGMRQKPTLHWRMR